ncbi:MAG: protein TolR [Deltaproteobacteria bacterium]|nr:protein TolR [Deltaproteobacteria bacterium]
MAGGVGGKGRFMGEINVVPLVDVMLVLLIIFMVAAPMMVQGVEVKLPETESGALKSDENLLVLSVTQAGQIYLDEFQVESLGLADKLKNIITRKPGTRVYLRADENVPYGIVVKVLAEARKAGVENLGMVTEPERVPPPVKKKSS